MADIPRLYRVLDADTGSPTFAIGVEGQLFALDRSIEDLHHQHQQGDISTTGKNLGPLAASALLAPVMPSKIICVGLNYQHHADEMNKTVPDEPLLFLKPPTTIIGPNQAIELPPESQEVHHEGELAIVVGAPLRDADENEAQTAIFGYTCACDVTARDIQRREKRYTRGKGFDTFLPLGPAISLAPEFIPADHHLSCAVNDEIRQSSPLDDFIFPIPFVLSFISRIMTLLPGDVILTGTPAGVGPIHDGDQVAVTIDGIGALKNPVRHR